MNLQPQPMAEAMQIVLAMSGGLRNIARQRIRLLARHARPDARLAGLLRTQDEIVDRLRISARLAQTDCARHIRAVAGEARAHVDDDRLPRRELARARLDVRQRGVRSTRYDR